MQLLKLAIEALCVATVCVLLLFAGVALRLERRNLAGTHVCMRVRVDSRLPRDTFATPTRRYPLFEVFDGLARLACKLQQRIFLARQLVRA